MGCGTSNISLEVMKTLENMVNVSEDNYVKSKAILINLMNQYRSRRDPKDKYVITIGPKGSGKSSLAQVLYGVDPKLCLSGSGFEDCTKEIKEPFNTKFANLKLIDSIGFTPLPHNLAKLLILLISKNCFPDFFVFPGERVHDLKVLDDVLSFGLIDILFVPFSPGAYYSALKMANQYHDPNPVKIAMEMGFNEIYRKGSEKYETKLKILESLNSVPIIESTMKDVFFKHFFKDDKFLDISYELFIKNKKSLNMTDRTVAYFYGCLINAIQCIDDINSINLEIKIRDQVEYLGVNNLIKDPLLS